jgi:ferrous iron transport protein A
MTILRKNVSLQQVIPLGFLAVGEIATIVDIDGQPDLVARLQEMGVRPGNRVRMIRPGTACLVAIGNHRFAFRGGEAASVLVESQGFESLNAACEDLS